MPITVQIQDERGDRLGDLWIHPLSSSLLAGDHPGTSCLRFIDLYGDTTFNQLQIPALVAELTELDSRLLDPELRLVLRDLIEFVSAAEDQMHCYVKFIGD